MINVEYLSQNIGHSENENLKIMNNFKKHIIISIIQLGRVTTVHILSFIIIFILITYKLREYYTQIKYKIVVVLICLESKGRSFQIVFGELIEFFR